MVWLLALLMALLAVMFCTWVICEALKYGVNQLTARLDADAARKAERAERTARWEQGKGRLT